MKISFISAAYKVDKYLPDFFSSFSNVKNVFEIIIVNDDPSNDLSEWITKYPNYEIKIVNNAENIGLRKSRLVGIENVSKDTTHIIFIDPDDRISTNAPEIANVDYPIQFAFMTWYKCKLIYTTCDGDVSRFELDNHLWGIVFPKKIALQIPRYTNEGEMDDMPIKLRMAENYQFTKSTDVLIDYRMRKGSLANGKKSERSAHEQIVTWRNLYERDHLIDRKKSISNQFFELTINKNAFEKSWYKSKYKEISPEVSFLIKFNAHMYRLVSWWALQNKLKSIFLNRKMFD